MGGVLFILVERWLASRQPGNQITWTIVVAIGIGQLIAAVFPGTSRSGVTILFALFLGLNRVAATEFTFLVGIPTMLAAGRLKIFKSLHHPVAGARAEDWGMLALAFVVAAAVSFVAVKWLWCVQTHTFVAFGWSRIGVAILIAILLLVFPRTTGSKEQKSFARRASFQALVRDWPSGSALRLLSHSSLCKPGI